MSTKRELLVDTALDLFYRFGVNSIGINEILKSSGVAKRTLYSNFGSKEALLLAALEQRHRNFIDWLGTKLKSVHDDRALIETLFEALASWFANHEPQLGDFRGCFFINTAAEFSDAQCEIAKYCHSHKQAVKTLIEQKMSQPNTLLLESICLLKEGAIVSAYMGGDIEQLRQNCIAILTAQQGCEVTKP
ncbi:TetR/AcrR family transcriptional regulator [Vibrio tritonius]|uniref:TetR/AcrR family transcriptional regulator n=1 Tax=Vibrio tritonius TaxID=1435069 RepID=UPI00315D9CFF